MTAKEPKQQVTLRVPKQSDGAAVHALVDACKPLDLNSLYLYLLVCTHFAQTSVVGEAEDGEIASLISGYLIPEEPETLFVWQVAVGEKARGQGIAKRMIREILSRPACHGVRYIKTTVTPSNAPSQALFQSVARDLEAPITEGPGFSQEDLGGGHEEERLFRIGPFNFNHKAGS